MLLEMLHALHESRDPHIVMGLRLQDPIPEWVSHIALVRSGKVTTGPKVDILAETEEARRQEKERSYSVGMSGVTQGERRALIEMKDVNVRYHERHVSPFFAYFPRISHSSLSIGSEKHQLDHPNR